MEFTVITIFPEMFTALECGITGRAKKNGLVKIDCLDLRDYADSKYRKVDDRPYGGGPGMVLLFEPLQKAISAAKASSDKPAKVIHLSPQGKLLQQKDLVRMSQQDNRLILISGRYEGIDERLIESEIDEEWSIGDYILSGGEIAAMVLIDAITRLLPGALGDETSILQDSFGNNDLLDYPHYTRPEIINGKSVPKVLLSGDHKAIMRWRLKESLGRTWLRRPDLLAKHQLTEEEQALLDEFISHASRAQ